MNHDLGHLLAALREQPDDDLASLALADWCLEQPDPATQARGDYVRLSTELTGLSGADPSVRERRKRLAAIATRWRAAWLGPLRDLGHRCDFLPGGRMQVVFTSGRLAEARKAQVKPPTDEQFAWVASLAVRAASVDDLSWLSGVLPTGKVRSFCLGVPADCQGLAEVLSRCLWLRGLRKLELYSHSVRLPDAEVAGMAGLRSLGELRDLTIWTGDLRAPACSALAGSPHLRELRDLALPFCGLTPVSLRALCTTAFAPPLVSLSLEGNGVSPEAAEVLASWPTLASVRRLTLSHNPLGDDGLAALVRSPYLGELRELKLQQCGLTTAGLKALARAPLGRLQSLDLQFNDDRLGDAGLLALSRSASLTSLRTLRHTRNRGRGLRHATHGELNARFGTGHNRAP